ncbi:MAG TPA: hypothetical protein VHY56_01735 [Candidatus Binataceae bacterium]|jgi:hypothetical protein|nr:hypothetical protein [Candidatus Binataceae bacterium]
MKRRFLLIGLIFVLGSFLSISNAQAQTKIIKPNTGLPFKITKSGSYFLGGNFAIVSKTTTAIVINANNVTLNLNGFVISGLGASATSGVGINASAATGVIIANGIVTGFGGNGISLGNNGMVENMQIYNNGGNGVDCSSSTACYVTGSVITGNHGTGLDFSDKSSGYLNDVLNSNTPDVSGGTNLGGNVCSGGAC